MNKILKNLHRYLTNNGFKKEAGLLVKVALDQIEFEKKYPKTYKIWKTKKEKSVFKYIDAIKEMESLGLNPDDFNITKYDDLVEILFQTKNPKIYNIWKSKQDQKMFVYLAQIEGAEDLGIDLENENISSFKDIIKILQTNKGNKRQTRVEEINNFLKENNQNTLSKNDAQLAIGANLSNEEILFLVKSDCRHSWDEKVKIADEFNKSKSTLFDEEVSILDFNSIDEARDELYFKKNPSPQKLKDFYEEIEAEAKRTSTVVYNSEKYIVIHSKSEKAAQYWEQSAVTQNKEGKIKSGLCSADPYESRFYKYDKKIHSFQIITKEYSTLTHTPRTSFSDKNIGYNLISFSINKKSGRVSWGGADTVNRYNKPVTKEALFFVLDDESDDIYNALTTYCKKELNINVLDLELEDKENALKNIDAVSYLNLGLDKKLDKDITLEKISKISSKNFFKYKAKIPEDIFNSLVDEKVKNLEPTYFLEYRDKIPKEIFDEFKLEKFKSADNNIFIFFAFQYKTLKEILSEEELREISLEKIKEAKPTDDDRFVPRSDIDKFFAAIIKDYVPKEYVDSFAYKKMSEYTLDQLKSADRKYFLSSQNKYLKKLYEKVLREKMIEAGEIKENWFMSLVRKCF